MKKIALLVALFIGAVIGSASWIGASIEERFPAFLQKSAALGQFQATVDAYERGLFRSTAQATILLQGLDGTAERIPLQLTLWHGPLPLGIDSNGDWHLRPAAAVIETRFAATASPTGMVGDLLTLLPELRNLSGVTTFGFSGSGQARFALPAFSRDFVNNDIKTTVEWGGLTGVETFDATLTNITGRFDSPGLKIIEPQFVIDCGQIGTTFRLNLAENGVMLGQINLNAESISGGDRGPDPFFVLKGFQLNNMARQETDTIGYTVEMVAENLLAAGRQFGPLGYEIDFSRLDTATIVGVQRQLQALQFDMVDTPSEELGDRILDIYLEALPALLQKAPVISLNYLRIQSPDGELWGKGKVVFDGANAPAVTDFASFAAIVSGDSEFQISATLLQAQLREFLTPQLAALRQSGQMGEVDDATFAASVDQAVQGQIANLVVQGLLTEEDGNYRLQFAYRQRQATLNGNPFPL